MVLETGLNAGIVQKAMIRPPDPQSPVPLFNQIADQLRWQVSTGALKPGTPLPATRDAATAWGVHRHTVGRAYRELRDSGLLVAGAGGRLVVAPTPPAGPETPGVDSFLRETLDMARAQLGLSPSGLVTALRHHAGADIELDHACAIECTPDQCRDLERQIESHWRVATETFCLADGGAPPEMPLVATLFHHEEIRERWPDRMGDTRFVAATVDPAMRALVEQAAPGERRHDVVLLVENDATRGLALSEDLEALLGPHYPVRLEVRTHRRGVRTLPEAEVVLATPAAHAALDEEDRRRPDVIRVRFAIDPRDLGALGVVFGWAPRPLRLARAHQA